MAPTSSLAAARVRSTNRYSALQSLIADQDTEIEDELARCTFPSYYPTLLTRSSRDLTSSRRAA